MKRTKYFPTSAEVLLRADKLSKPEARFAVANYYEAQDMRKRCDMQLRHLGEKDNVAALNVGLLMMTSGMAAEAENVMKEALDKYASADVVGRWMMSQHGVGPVIAAGMLAHLDVTKSDTAGGFWRFAGQDPTCKWKKGEKRPYNAAMKQLVFHFGECVKRTHNHPDSFYGEIYRSRKAYLVARNERGENAERAKTFVTKSTDWKKTLASGKLPDGNIDRQACNYTAKIFLSHLHAVMYWHHYGKATQRPFAISMLGHAHEIKIMNVEKFFPGFSEAYYGKYIIEETDKKIRSNYRTYTEAAE